MKKIQDSLASPNKFAYVIQETNTEDRKRILITKDIKTFIRSCCRTFNNPNLVRIINANGQTISNVDEITPGQEYFATEIGADFVQVTKTTSNSIRNQNKDPNESLELFVVPDSPRKSPRSRSPINSPTRQSKEEREKERMKTQKIKDQLVKIQDSQSEDESPGKGSKRFNDNKSVSGRSISGRSISGRSISGRSISGRSIGSSKNSILMKPGDTPLSRNISRISLNVSSSDNEEESESDTFSDIRSMGTATRIHRYGSKTSVASSQLLTSEVARSIEASVQSKYADALSQQEPSPEKQEKTEPPQDYKFLQDSITILTDPLESEETVKLDYLELEKGQIAAWIQKLSNTLFFNRGEQESPFIALNDIYAKQIVREHAFISHTHFHHSMKLLITGPHGSGVSSLMSSVGKELAYQLASTDEWKQHFVFGFDFENFITNSATDFASMYKAMVELVLNAISIQKPNVVPHIVKIKKQMFSILDFEIPSKRLHPFFEIDEIAKLYSALWRNPEAMENWMTAIFSLPEVLSKALGFTSITVFIDNLEKADLVLSRKSPFMQSPKAIFLIEHIKYALNRSNFVISCQDYTILRPVDDFGIDLTKGLHIVSTTDTPVDLLEGKSQVLQFKIAHEVNPVIVSDEICGGIPKFMDMWEDLVSSFIKYERVKSSKKDGYYVVALEAAQKVADEMFRFKDGKKVSVLEISRPKDDQKK